MSNLIKIFDQMLASSLSEFGLSRVVSGFYVSSIDAVIWKGLAASPMMRHGELSVFPGIGIYCPESYKLIKMVFRSMGNQGFETGAMSQNMGVPFINEPLNKLVSKSMSFPRLSGSYNVRDEGQIKKSVDLICHDFAMVKANVFVSINNVHDLIIHIKSGAAGRSPISAINLMALTLTMNRASKVDKKRSMQNLEIIRSSYSNPLSDEFYEHLQKFL